VDGKKRSPRFYALATGFVLLVSVVLLALLELAVQCFLWFPGLTEGAPESIRTVMLRLYTYHDKPLVHAYTEWDEQLTYRLEPGLNRPLQGREFDVQLIANSLGLRDDEPSLQGPEIIGLGDSFTMGYGVEQEQSFIELLGKDLEQRTLNAGISSYGTARECLLFNERLDKSALKLLVIQHCENDLLENQAFVAGDGTLPNSPREFYAKQVQDLLAKQTYRPGENLRNVTRLLGEQARYRSEHETPASEREIHARHAVQAYLFVEVLKRMGIGDNVQVVILDLADRHDVTVLRPEWRQHGLRHDGNLFMRYVDHFLKQPTTSENLQRALLLDTSTFLSKDHYFLLDGHLNALGHKRVAENLAALLKSKTSVLPTHQQLRGDDELANLLLRDKLPDAAMKGAVLTATPDLRAHGDERVHVNLLIRNDSKHWWPHGSLLPGARHQLVLAPQILTNSDKVGEILTAAVSELPHPVGPGEEVKIHVRVPTGSFKPGTTDIRFDILQQQHKWFGSVGGDRAVIKVVK
jgi:lysophospholipase L1-like esterase